MKRAREKANCETAAKEWERTAQLSEARALAAEERLTRVTLANEALVEQLRLSRENTERERENVATLQKKLVLSRQKRDEDMAHFHAVQEGTPPPSPMPPVEPSHTSPSPAQATPAPASAVNQNGMAIDYSDPEWKLDTPSEAVELTIDHGVQLSRAGQE